MIGEPFAIVIWEKPDWGVGVSLNRLEQQLFDYIEKNPEERQHWLYKVRGFVSSCADGHEAAIQLEAALWAYYKERSAVVPSLSEGAARHGLMRTSMRNLAEYLVRLWTEPRAKKARPSGPASYADF